MSRPRGAEPEAVPSPLEVRYRRWLRCYPPSYRAAREDELVTVLLDGADPVQQRPRPAEVFDLLRGGLGARWRAGTRSPAGQAWREAAALVTVGLPVLLALRGVAYLVVLARYVATWNDPSGAHRAMPWALYASHALAGWPTAAAWAAVAIAMLAGRPRLAALTAIVAGAAEATAITSFIRDGQAYRAEGLVPWLAVSVVAVTLLARPARVTRGLERVGRRRLVVVTLGLATAVAARLWFSLQPGDLTYLGAALVVTAATTTRSWRDAAARRVLVGAVAVALMLRVGGEAHRTLNQRHTTGPDLAIELLAALAVPLVLVAATEIAASLLRTARTTTRKLSTGA